MFVIHFLVEVTLYTCRRYQEEPSPDYVCFQSSGDTLLPVLVNTVHDEVDGKGSSHGESGFCLLSSKDVLDLLLHYSYQFLRTSFRTCAY